MNEEWYYFVEPFDETGHPVHCFMTRNTIIKHWVSTRPEYAASPDDEVVEMFCSLHWATVVPSPFPPTIPTLEEHKRNYGIKE